MTKNVIYPTPNKGTKVWVWDSHRRKSESSEVQEVLPSKQGINGKLSAPYDKHMGVFSLDDLKRNGKVSAQGVDAYLPECWELAKAEVLKKFESVSLNHDDQKNRELLGMPNHSPLTEKLVRDAAISKAKQVHPDVVGGAPDKMQEVNKAREELTSKAKEQKRASQVWGKGN